MFALVFPPEAVDRALIREAEGHNEATYIDPQLPAASTNPLINKLIQCESGGQWDIKVLDVNDRYSYGGLQFQLATFWGFGKAYKILPVDIELAEAENLIYDPETQIKIAERMFEDGLQHHWKNCWNIIKDTF